MSTGRTFGEKCNLHTDCFSIGSFKKIHFKLSIHIVYFTCLWGSYMLSFGSFFGRAPASEMAENASCFHYKSNILLFLWVYRNKISFEQILSCFIIRKQSRCLENKSSAVVLRIPNCDRLLIHDSQITSCGPVKVSQRARCGLGAVQCPGLHYNNKKNLNLKPLYNHSKWLKG